jgi:hypothetical protein
LRDDLDLASEKILESKLDPSEVVQGRAERSLYQEIYIALIGVFASSRGTEKPCIAQARAFQDLANLVAMLSNAASSKRLSSLSGSICAATLEFRLEI